jgi:hypothetical protein
LFLFLRFVFEKNSTCLTIYFLMVMHSFNVNTDALCAALPLLLPPPPGSFRATRKSGRMGELTQVSLFPLVQNLEGIR